MLQNVFTILLVLGFLMNGFHDWVDIPGWTHGQVRAALGMKKLVIGTAVNCIFPGLAAGLAIYYWQKSPPAGVRNFWLGLLRDRDGGGDRHVVDPVFPGDGSEDQRPVLKDVRGEGACAAGAWG